MGMVISIYFDDHNPPHFHVAYNDDEALICITNLSVLEGRLPARVMGLVMDWAELHRDELLQNWNMVKDTGKYFKIAPLT